MFYSEQQRAEIVRLASGVLADEVSVLEGCRRLSSLLDWNMEDRERLGVILLVDSETEDHPLQQDEHLWAPESLATRTALVTRYLETVRDDVERACQFLVNREQS